MRVTVLIGLSSLLTLVTAAQPATETSEDERRPPPGGYQPKARKHIGRSGDHVTVSPSSNENATEAAISGSLAPMVPTRSSFIANWQKVNEATGYRLDVSTSDSFSDYINGYHDLDVGIATSWVVTDLTPGVKYYYRVRAYNMTGTSSHSAVMSATTAAGSGLVINATFDSSITSNPNFAAIESMINQAIAIYESLFRDPITISILFRYSTTQPDGMPIGTALSESDFVVYPIQWNSFISALKADATTSNDTTANASLPANPLSTNIIPSSASGRAIGLNTPPGMFANGSVGNGGPYDGIVTLNSGQPFQFTRPTNAGNYDALRSTEHEMDEVLGLGSYLGGSGSDLRPQDLFSWSGAGTRNLSSSGLRYFSIDSGNTDIVGFNQDPNGDFGDWLSPPCPQANPFVQDAFSCAGQFSDVSATSPEGINLDVIGYDLVHSLSPAPDGGYAGNNTAEGSGALNSLTSGTFDTAIGAAALSKNTTGFNNTAVGGNALLSNTMGVYNTANGLNALVNNTTGNYNTGTGGNALLSNTTATENTATGVNTLLRNTAGTYNTATGLGALYNNTMGNYNTATGGNALYSNTTATENTATGVNALSSNTSGSDNTANGFEALFSNTTGSGNTANGFEALQANTAIFNTADGFEALFSNTSGSDNTAVGGDALFANTTGSSNVAVGWKAGGNLTSGNNNIIIGANVLGTSSDAATIRIGGTQSATFIAGISGVTVTGAGVVVSSTGQLGVATSSERFKDEIKPMEDASDAILALEPVTFRYKKELDPEEVPQFGLVAEQVEKVNPDLVLRDKQGKVYTVRYEAVNAMLLNEFLKEHRKVEEQEKIISQLKSTVGQQQKGMAVLAASLKEQAAQIRKVSTRLELNTPAPQLAGKHP